MGNKSKYISSYTLGCKVNQYDTEAVIENFKKQGYEEVAFDEVADVYIVNTCTVTHLSDRKCRQMLRRTKKINKDSILVAMGCYAQSASQKLREEIPEIDIIVGTDRRSEIVNIVENYYSEEIFKDPVSDIMEVTEFEELTISKITDHTRAYIKIQEGCNNYCTYCIIPYVRGKIRSRKEENVITEAIRLSNEGIKEIILTGIHVASYGKELEDVSLNTLLPKLNEIQTIDRIRMSSIEPIVVTDEFIRTISKTSKLCKHFHLSLQSGSDSVLKRMKRKYNTKEYLESVKKLKSLWPDVGLTTDIIVGFPGETDQEFEETLQFVEEVGFCMIHIFPFSPREGTVAHTMPDQISSDIKSARANKLKQLEQKLRYKYMDNLLNSTQRVLFEKGNTGLTSNYIKVEVNTDLNLENKLLKVKIIRRENDILIGELV